MQTPAPIPTPSPTDEREKEQQTVALVDAMDVAVIARHPATSFYLRMVAARRDARKD